MYLKKESHKLAKFYETLFKIYILSKMHLHSLSISSKVTSMKCKNYRHTYYLKPMQCGVMQSVHEKTM